MTQWFNHCAISEKHSHMLKDDKGKFLMTN